VLALVFSYEVRDAAEFERVYGPDGEWAEFFRQGRGFVGTELLRDVEAPGRYLVIDRWESADAYNAFVAERREEYIERVDATRFRYDSELRFGTFENVFP
jgi:heme-degrading monooxygenase HmoA